MLISISGREGFSAPGLKKQISALQSEGIEAGIQVYSLGKKKRLFSYQENKPLMVASNLKILTSLVALKMLGPDFRFKTSIYTDGKISGKTLHGNLFIKGFGDPKLVSEQLWYLTNDLVRKGFQTVTGDLILDDTYFDAERDVEQSDGKNGERAFDASLGALSVNFNTTAIYVQPGNKPKQKARVYVDPDNDYINIQNQSKTGEATDSLTLNVSRLSGKKGDTILVTGIIPWGYSEMRFYRNISDPSKYAAALFRRFFKERGISIYGKNRYESIPSHVHELMTYESQPMRHMIADLNRFSNNFIAEQILKTVGGETKGLPGTTDKGVSVLKDFLKSLNVQGDFQVVNGSGLSQKNKLSAAQLVTVLKAGYEHFEWGPEYVSSLSIMGVDGTLEKRLKNTSAYRHVRAKTGSLTGVSGISGYVGTESGDILAFSLLMNDPKDRYLLMQKTQDEILLQLCEW